MHQNHQITNHDQDFTSSKVLTGVPILFIPGNSGSYKQVRSIASESARFYAKPTYFYDHEDNEGPEIRVP